MPEFIFSDMNDLIHGMSMKFISSDRSFYTQITGVDAGVDNVTCVAEAMDYEFDIAQIWCQRQRWSMMIRQYLDEQDVRQWLNMCVSKIGLRGKGQAVLRTKVVRPRGGTATNSTNIMTRRWGSCMLSVSYRTKPRPTITLHSRTSYIGYLAALDVNVAHVLARYLADAFHVPVSTFRFVWFCEVMQWHGFKSAAWLLSNSDPETRRLGRRLLIKKRIDLTPEELKYLESPATQMSREWLTMVRKEDAAGINIGLTNYNTYRRVRRRWHTEVLGYEAAQSFEGYSVYPDKPRFREQGLVGQDREWFKAYLPLPHDKTSDCDLAPIGIPQNGWLGIYPEPLEIDESDLDICVSCGRREDMER